MSIAALAAGLRDRYVLDRALGRGGMAAGIFCEHGGDAERSWQTFSMS